MRVAEPKVSPSTAAMCVPAADGPSGLSVDGSPGPVRRVFERLEDLGIPYCLLGSLDQLQPSGRYQEIDLLVREADLARMGEISGAEGFVPIPGWGHAPHHFYVAFVAEQDLWVKLDMVTALSFGAPIRAWRLDGVDEVLERRRAAGGIRVLSRGDEVLVLLLKLLFQTDCPERQKQRLETLYGLSESLAGRPLERQRLASRVEELFGESLPPQRLLAALEGRRWQDVQQQRGVLVRRLLRHQPVATAARFFWGLAARRLRPLLFVLRRRGLRVALLAPDGGGKTTLARALGGEPFIQARYVYLGLYGKQSSLEWLERAARRPGVLGWLGRRLTSLRRVLLHRGRLLEAFYHRLRGRFVVFDRFHFEPRPSQRPRSWRSWLRETLLGTGGRPELTVLLDAPGRVLFERKQERNPEDLERQRQEFLQLAREQPIHVVDATRDADRVRRTVVSLIWERYGRERR